MKKIINGKMYNTETAQELGTYSNGGGWRDFHHFEETLYRKRTGEFFLFGEGNAASRYSEAVGLNEWSGGSRIMPMSFDEARSWAEEHLDADDYEEIFGAVPEDDSREALSISLSATAAELARRQAARQDLSLSAYIESLIRQAEPAE